MNCRCGKRGYSSEIEAKRAHRESNARLRFYECNGVWHATNDEKNRVRRSRQFRAKRRRARQTERRKTKRELDLYRY